MEANAQRKEQENLFTLSIGTKGRLNDTEYLIIGAVRFVEISSYNQNQSEYWTEYLLYNTQQGFAWLIESGKRWRLSETLQTWPDFDSSGNPAGEMLIDHYRGQVEVAAGAFIGKSNKAICFITRNIAARKVMAGMSFCVPSRARTKLSGVKAVLCLTVK